MFFGIIKNKKNKIILHASATNTLTSSNHAYKHYVRRTFLFSSASGSLTVEASIVLPIYLLFLTSVIYILNILSLENYMQEAMEEASRSVSSHAYLYERFDNLDFFNKMLVIGSNSTFVDSLIETHVNTALLKKAFLTDDLKHTVDDSYIEGGYSGIHIFAAFSGSKNHLVDFRIKYFIEIPFLSPDILTLAVSQRCYFRPFIGEDITDKTGDFSQYVYVTTSGSVYHTSPYCSYLSKYVSILPSSLLEQSFNQTESYLPCNHCARNLPPSDNCFLCPGSHVYHNRIDCFYLNANIYKVTLDSVRDTMDICSRCTKGVK